MKCVKGLFAGCLFILNTACRNIDAPIQSFSENVDSPARAVKGSSENTNFENIATLAINTGGNSKFIAAIRQADMFALMEDTNALTIFVPNDVAFDALPARILDDLMIYNNKDALRNFLTGYLINGTLQPADLADGMELTMLNGARLKVQIKDERITLNDSVHVTDLAFASNGVIYFVDRVILPSGK